MLFNVFAFFVGIWQKWSTIVNTQFAHWDIHMIQDILSCFLEMSREQSAALRY